MSCEQMCVFITIVLKANQYQAESKSTLKIPLKHLLNQQTQIQ